MKCDYEGCKQFGCSQERLLGLSPCADSAEGQKERRIAAVVALVGAVLLLVVAVLK